MVTINMTVWEFHYGGNRIGGEVVFSSKGYVIDGYDIDKYTIEEALQMYVKKNHIDDEIEIKEV